MIIQSIDIENGKELNTDICIVGAGIAGLSFALQFVNSSHNLIVLESGGLKPDPETQLLASGNNIGYPYYDLDTARFRAFGGSSHSWHVDLKYKDMEGVRLRPLGSIDFEKRDWVAYSGWPITKSDLDPYYERAHQVFKIGPYNYDIDYWNDSSQNRDTLFDENHFKPIIFQFARKDVFYSDYRQEFEKADNIDVYLNSTVLKVNLTEDAGKTDSVLVSSNKDRTFSVKAKYFVLAQGGLETPRLMLLSRDKMKAGVGNQHDLVGRFFMEHPHLKGAIFYPGEPAKFQRKNVYDMHRNKDTFVMAKVSLSEEIIRKEKLLNHILIPQYRPLMKLELPLKAFKKILTAVRRGHIDKKLAHHLKTVAKNPGHLTTAAVQKLVSADKSKWERKTKYMGFLLRMMCEQAPDPESRVQLGRSTDPLGMNVIELKWNLKSSDISDIRRYLDVFTEHLQNSHPGKMDILVDTDSFPEDLDGGYHHMGTTRMSTDPKQGVVDKNCRVHGIQNLFIAGSSVFPTCGYANPTLTIAALSIRLADNLKKVAAKNLQGQG